MAERAGNPITGGSRISEAIDSYDILIVHVDQQGLFGGHRQGTSGLAGIFDGEQNKLVVHAPA
ncbi:hypothetical protein [Streptomyces sp. NPDC001933]|uniref:hypothetical protein n=1 Tax=Streptomyces sp. NPDC001933 TaxID=3364626 RepID=UPI0036CCACE8